MGLRLIQELESLPGSANTFSRFFNVFSLPDFKRRLLSFVKGEDNIYEWQEMYMLDSLLRFDSFTKAELRIFSKIAFNKNKHPLTRSKALLLLGKFGDEPERVKIMNKFNDETDYLVKRAMILATQEVSIAERNDFYNSIKVTDSEQSDLVKYIKSFTKPVYYDDFVYSPIPISDELY